MSRSVQTLAVALTTLLIGLVAATAAPAHPGHPHAGGKGFFGSAPIDPAAYAGLTQNPSGPCGSGYEVRSKGPDGKEHISCTHGPDAPPPGAYSSKQNRSVNELRASADSLPSTPEAVMCDGANSTGKRVVAIYAFAAGQPDRSAQLTPVIRQLAGVMDDIYYESARETAGSRRIRWLTEASPDGACRVKVEKLALSATGDDNFSNTLTEAHNAGFTSFDRRFVIWMDGVNPSGICGIGELWPDDSPGQDNQNNGGVNTGYFGLVSRIDQNCWANASQSVEGHELGHNLGAVQNSAPHASGGSHCVDEWDIMCYSDTPNFPAMTYVCGTQGGDRSHDNRLDCNHDDYFHTNPAAGSYLATHWNVPRNNLLREAGLAHSLTTVVSTGDGDSAVEPGETFTLNERVVNQGTTTATGISGALSSPSGHVTAPGTRTYPNAANLGTSTNTSPFSVTLAAAAPCGSPVPLTLRLTTDQGIIDVPVSVPTGGESARTTTAGAGFAIPDGSPTGASSAVALTGTARIRDVDITLNITHTWDSDLSASVTGPDGTSVTLFGGVGGSGDNFTNTVLDDEAATAIAAGVAPFTGSFRPQSALSALDGKPIAGNWTLTVADSTPQDDGTVNSWGFRRATAVCSIAPPPAAPPSAGWSAPSSAKGDFNGDGIADLAVGAPGENAGAGAVHIMLGSATGLTATGSQYWSQNSAGIADSEEAGDRFAAALAVGDVNGDGRADLAVGAPGEDNAAGQVHVLLGSASGLTSTGNQLWNQNTAGIASSSEAGDRFGAAVAIGNVGGSTHADLAVGAPGENTGAGAVHALFGSASGPSATGSQFWSQNTGGVADSEEAGDAFGTALALADLGGTTLNDLAIGTPGENSGAGHVHVLPGSTTGLTATGSQLWSQASTGIADGPETGDRFGAALAAGNLGFTTQADLAVGAPGEDAGAGGVHTIYGTASGLASTNSQLWNQGVAGVTDSPEAADAFGAALATADFGGTTHADLAVGTPGENAGAGHIHVLPGSSTGVTATGSQLWSQASTGIVDSPEAADAFGSSVTALNVGRSAQADLVAGAPGENTGRGALHVVFGTATGLSSTNAQYFSQASAGIASDAEDGDNFGGGLSR